MADNPRVVFLPWLNLCEDVHLEGLKFVPWTQNGTLDPRLSSIPDLVWRLLGHYVEADGGPITHATFVISDRNEPLWHFGEETIDRIGRKVLLLFLAVSATNRYD